MEEQRDKTEIEPYALVIVKLLQGFIHDTDKQWNDLLHYEINVSDYFGRIGIELIIDKKDGYSFLKQIDLDEDGKTIGLIKRMPLSYEVTLIAVLLREWLDEFEVRDTDSKNLFISRKDLKDRIELFFKEKTNQVKLLNKLDQYVNEIESLGFLKKSREDLNNKDETQYEVRRVIKAKITNDKLEEFKKRLEKDVQSL